MTEEKKQSKIEQLADEIAKAFIVACELPLTAVCKRWVGDTYSADEVQEAIVLLQAQKRLYGYINKLGESALVHRVFAKTAHFEIPAPPLSANELVFRASVAANIPRSQIINDWAPLMETIAQLQLKLTTAFLHNDTDQIHILTEALTLNIFALRVYIANKTLGQENVQTAKKLS